MSFDFVKNNRPLTKSFILELHQLVTTHQEKIEAITSLGQVVEISLLKGQFKKHENNPKRANGGTKFMYCPPVQVDAQMDKLISIYQDLDSESSVHPVIISTWFHHAFVQIHPFQDGNGRMARLLASLILIKHNLFPLNVDRSEGSYDHHACHTEYK